MTNKSSTEVASAAPAAIHTGPNQLLFAHDQALAELEHDAELPPWSIDTNDERREHDSTSNPDEPLAVAWHEWD